MKNSKVKIFKAIYYLLYVVMIMAVGYLGSLALNTDLMIRFNLRRLIIGSLIALFMISSEFVLSFKIRQIN